jgi:hypothetical protein
MIRAKFMLPSEFLYWSDSFADTRDSVVFYITAMIYVRIRLHHVSRITMHYADLVTSKATYISVLMFHVQALINIKDILYLYNYNLSLLELPFLFPSLAR